MKIQITEKSFVRISKHENGFYVQLVYNNGSNGGKLYVYKKESQALKKASKIKFEYLNNSAG